MGSSASSFITEPLPFKPSSFLGFYFIPHARIVRQANSDEWSGNVSSSRRQGGPLSFSEGTLPQNTRQRRGNANSGVKRMRGLWVKTR